MTRRRAASADAVVAGLPCIVPDWKVDAHVRAFVTTRCGGVSGGNWGLGDGCAGGLNLGARCGDDPLAVAVNRERLSRALPSSPVWLEQVHGVAVHRALAPPDDGTTIEPRADASVTSQTGVVLAILTADCLPVLLTDTAGTAIGAAHAGWRGLAGGVLERTVEALPRASGSEVIAWLGPAIGPSAFEVGHEVRAVFCDDDASCATAFVAAPADGKWLADLYRLATIRLARVGVHRVSGAAHCTVRERRLFYSYRRDGSCGRMASLIWLESR